MSYRTQAKRSGASKQFSKSSHEKKAKDKKQRKGAKYLLEETPQATPQEVADRTLGGINNLGNQVFALSPFSQYFDDWLVNLRRVISEFESNPSVNVDEQFQKERDQIFADAEAALAQNRIEESSITEEAKALQENNHKIADADRDYAEKTRDLSNKRNSEVQQLTNKIRMLEDDLKALQDAKIGFFKFSEKKQNSKRITEVTNELTDSKNTLEITIGSFIAEQDKLHDNYEKHKQDLFAESDRLHKVLEKLETDTSTTARQTACNALAEAIKTVMTRSAGTS